MAGIHVDSGTLYRQYSEFVARFLMRYGASPQEVDDLVQDVFVVAHRKGGFEVDRAKPTSWLAAIALRVASDRRRKRARKRKRELIDSDAVTEALATASSPGAAVQARERIKRVRRALRMMPGAKRAVFVMYEVEGRTCDEIAQALRIPVGTVYSRLHSARSQFTRNVECSSTERPLALCESLSFVSLGV